MERCCVWGHLFILEAQTPLGTVRRVQVVTAVVVLAMMVAVVVAVVVVAVVVVTVVVVIGVGVDGTLL